MFFAGKKGRRRVYKNSAPSPHMLFSLRYGIRFLGCFLLGMLCSRWLESDLAADLGILLPPLLTNLFTSSEPWLAALPDLLLVALLLTFPVAALYFIGLRDYDFFCLSRFWNLLFCLLHGVLFEHLVTLWLNNLSNLYGHVIQGVVSVLILTLTVLLQFLLHNQLLHANRIAAAGVSLPCLNKNRFQYPHMDPLGETQSWQTRLLRYFGSLLRSALSVFVMEVLMLVLCYGLRKMMQI